MSSYKTWVKNKTILSRQCLENIFSFNTKLWNFFNNGAFISSQHSFPFKNQIIPLSKSKSNSNFINVIQAICTMKKKSHSAVRYQIRVSKNCYRSECHRVFAVWRWMVGLILRDSRVVIFFSLTLTGFEAFIWGASREISDNGTEYHIWWQSWHLCICMLSKCTHLE